MPARVVRERIKKIVDVYPNWPRAQAWLRELRQGAAGNRTQLAFGDLASVIDEIGRGYGRWQDAECSGLKRDLVALEHPSSTGCTRLADFYGSGKWQFAESPDYLRSLGALDESYPDSPNVLTANYMLSTSNCVASSHFYRVCCRDTCAELHDQVLRAIGAPTATPSQVVEALGEKPTDLLQQRLRDVARRSKDGRVRLHGRLFAQWLHQLRPQSCPFPHLAGATHPDWVDNFESISGHSATVTQAQIREILQRLSPGRRPTGQKAGNATHSGTAALSCVPWRPQEELLVPEHFAREDPMDLASYSAFLLASASLLVGLWRTIGRVRPVATAKGGAATHRAAALAAHGNGRK